MRETRSAKEKEKGVQRGNVANVGFRIKLYLFINSLINYMATPGRGII